MKGGDYSLRDIIAPVRGMGRTAKLQNFWLSVLARYDIRTPQDLVNRADRLWKIRNVSERTISAIVMSAGRFGIVVPPHPNCKKQNLSVRKTYGLRQMIVMAGRPRMTDTQKATEALWRNNHD